MSDYVRKGPGKLVGNESFVGAPATSIGPAAMPPGPIVKTESIEDSFFEIPVISTLGNGYVVDRMDEPTEPMRRENFISLFRGAIKRKR